MSLSMLYGETEIGISVDITPYLTKVGLDIDDRVGVIFMIKSNASADDDDAEYSVEEGTFLTVDGNTITAKISEYANLVVGTQYFIGFGIKFAGDTKYREMPLVPSKRDIKFRQDVIRE